ESIYCKIEELVERMQEEVCLYKFEFSPQLWAKIYYSVLLAYAQVESEEKKEKIIELFKPLYYAKAASYACWYLKNFSSSDLESIKEFRENLSKEIEEILERINNNQTSKFLEVDISFEKLRRALIKGERFFYQQTEEFIRLRPYFIKRWKQEIKKEADLEKIDEISRGFLNNKDGGEKIEETFKKKALELLENTERGREIAKFLKKENIIIKYADIAVDNYVEAVSPEKEIIINPFITSPLFLSLALYHAGVEIFKEALEFQAWRDTFKLWEELKLRGYNEKSLNSFEQERVRDLERIGKLPKKKALEELAKRYSKEVLDGGYILVTGGAGYIGSFVVQELLKAGLKIIVIDNLSKGYKEALPEEVIFIEGDLEDITLLEEVFSKYKIEGVIHLAGFIEVRESIKNPAKYFANNIITTLNLLETMRKYKVKKIIFSSSAAVYGAVSMVPILEDVKERPENPYGETKLLIEKILKEYDEKEGIRFVSLRYFNAAGASKDGRLGEAHIPETHLIPKLFEIVLGKRDYFELSKEKYPTPDGTGIRDYVHVEDLARAHILALRWLDKEKRSDIFNLGTAKGASVLEVVKEVERIIGRQLPKKVTDRKPSGVPILVADYKKAEKILGWRPRYGLSEIIESAWRWHKNNPQGFGKLPKGVKELKEIEYVTKVIKGLSLNRVISKEIKFEIILRLLKDLIGKDLGRDNSFVKKTEEILNQLPHYKLKEAVEEKLIEEFFKLPRNLIWISLASHLGIWWQYLKKEFLSILEKESLPEKIRALWRLRDIYFNLDLSKEQREDILEIIFEILKERKDEDLWKNAKEILTEMFEAKEKEIWLLAFKRSLESLKRKDEEKAWKAITEAIIPVRGEKENVEIDKKVLAMLKDEDRNVRIAGVLILRDLKPKKVDFISVLKEALEREKDSEVKELIIKSLERLEHKRKLKFYPAAISLRGPPQILKITPQETSLGLQKEQFSDEEGNLKKEYVFVEEYPFSKVHLNPIQIYQSKITGKKILLKYSPEYVLWSEYISYRFFALLGLPVPQVSLVRKEGKLAIAIEYLEGFEEIGFKLPQELIDNLSIKSAILLSCLLNDRDRTPENILINKEGKIVHIDFGASLFARATGGFVPFKDCFTKEEFERIIHTIRLDLKQMVNEAYEVAAKDEEFLSQLALAIGAITNEQIKAIVKSSGIPYGEESINLINNWIEALTAEGEFGNWNRKSRSRFTDAIRTLQVMKKYGGLGEYVEQALIKRRDDIVKIFSKKHQIDLHHHTRYSDGLKEPKDVVYEAKLRGILAIGICDHNTFDGLKEALKEGKELGVEVIPGIEIDVYEDDLKIENFHVLIYFSPEKIFEVIEKNPEFIKKLNQRVEDERRRINLMVERFNKVFEGKFEITKEDLKGKLTRIPNIYELGKVLFEKYGSQKLGVSNYREATKKYFKDKRVYLRPEEVMRNKKNGLSLSEVIDFAVRNKGVLVFAHPLEKMDIVKVKKILEKYPYFGGVEVYSSKHTEEEFRLLENLVEKLNDTIYKEKPLIKTTGSDGHNEEDIIMGIGSIRKHPQGNIPSQKARYQIVYELKKLLDGGKINLVIPTTLRRPDIVEKVLKEVEKQRERLKNKGFDLDVNLVIPQSRVDKGRKLSQKYRLNIIIEERKGKAAAINTAFKQLKDKGDFLIMMDADFSYPAEYILKIAEVLKEKEVVIGSRLRGVIEKEAMPFIHRLANEIITLEANLISLFTGRRQRISDLCTGMWGFQNKAIKRIEIERRGFTLEANLFVEILKKNLKTGEIPILYRKALRPGRIKLKDFFKITGYLALEFFSVLKSALKEEKTLRKGKSDGSVQTEELKSLDKNSDVREEVKDGGKFSKVVSLRTRWYI
ncbi:MAG: UDP-glucose 4-epimerase GalE, partial [Candidatus Omnitrophica bacterium 4484_70.1]